MDLFSLLIPIIGLSLFETISSIDNAIINAEVLSGMSARARRWFLFWGIIFAVFVVRGLLPWVIVWMTTPSLSFIGALTATFSSDPKVAEAIESSAPILMMGGGIFLLFLFLHWLFLESKNFGLPVVEKFFYANGLWFYSVVSVLLTVIVWISLKKHPMMAFSAVIGSSAFFITHGFKSSAEKSEKELLSSGASDLSKILYLEVIDATFSIDGVLGAFAFTMSVPIILLGNGLGAVVVRQLTIGNIERVKKYIYLKNGAMYSILFLGSFMILKSFGVHIPEWASTVVTCGVVLFFFLKSKKANGKKK
ncbi:MAG TPA: hypothetical protein DEE98_01790 [Elusimicrobia bacterium]|nr:MAG: hypothetical protein A2278_03985 [Elusimicrobia bacterium RIFOXYA12_FULL_49_49]OGS11729.1 MAG: hypothetical protein A2386_02380 [Elusimicrobia bacterium RIFOXYB1_FULL_48_9]OGS15319.1 MAG: hypothetical protein A2251_07300 [Elusimicrobia bacterium RIFOXYA2_FULL_47_53]OGS26527.1 MAG: hypothetical protein A2339_06820 [Elusimicrobia bacterium RIFOXYB12_FULL_50_12]OGS30574.1 MAG: hypothetical protein A2323_02420 [Elusimicrobia bacterium RIFOXYB2_FULL_46_23]HBU69094.1 hypothetical protein [El